MSTEITNKDKQTTNSFGALKSLFDLTALFTVVIWTGLITHALYQRGFKMTIHEQLVGVPLFPAIIVYMLMLISTNVSFKNHFVFMGIISVLGSEIYFRTMKNAAPQLIQGLEGVASDNIQLVSGTMPEPGVNYLNIVFICFFIVGCIYFNYKYYRERDGKILRIPFLKATILTFILYLAMALIKGEFFFTWYYGVLIFGVLTFHAYFLSKGRDTSRTMMINNNEKDE